MNTRNARPHWIEAFQAAILELDAARLPAKVTEAKHAILDRIEELHGINADSERYELRTALQTLAELDCLDGFSRSRIMSGHES
jgi:hypothetical protein